MFLKCKERQVNQRINRQSQKWLWQMFLETIKKILAVSELAHIIRKLNSFSGNVPGYVKCSFAN